jgi:hypothetical protein
MRLRTRSTLDPPPRLYDLELLSLEKGPLSRPSIEADIPACAGTGTNNHAELPVFLQPAVDHLDTLADRQLLLRVYHRYAPAQVMVRSSSKRTPFPPHTSKDDLRRATSA